MTDLKELCATATQALDNAFKAKDSDWLDDIMTFMDTVDDIGRYANLFPEQHCIIESFVVETVPKLVQAQIEMGNWLGIFQDEFLFTVTEERFARVRVFRSSLEFLFELYSGSAASEYIATLKEDISEIDEDMKYFFEIYGPMEPAAGTPLSHWWWLGIKKDE